MSNRFPLVLDTSNSNQVKELPAGDNLNLQDSSIVNVQNIDAIGTINAAAITVNGNSIKAQTVLDLVDTPSSYTGNEGSFLKVNERGDGVEFRSLENMGQISVTSIILNGVIIPETPNVGLIGTSARPFREINATALVGSLYSSSGEIIVDALSGTISYSKIEDAPSSLSNFVDDLQVVTTSTLIAEIENIKSLADYVLLDIRGDIYNDDSSKLIDIGTSTYFGHVDAESIRSREDRISLGIFAGDVDQQPNAIAIGVQSGYQNQERHAIAIGTSAGQIDQNSYSIAIGVEAGYQLQGSNCIAIGNRAGFTKQHSNSIILSTSILNSLNEGFFVDPIRVESTQSLLFYNPTTKEITQNSGVLHSDVVGSIYADDSTQVVNVVDGSISSPYANIFELLSEQLVLMPGSIPSQPAPGTIAVSDGISWNPTGSGLQHLMIYLNNIWLQIA